MDDVQAENLRIVKVMAENGLLGRWDIVRQYVSDDLVMHVPPGLPFGRDYCGWDGYLQVFKELGAFSEQSLKEATCVLGRVELWRRLGTAEHALMFAVKEYEENR